jgi:hypothetical protein
LREDVHDLGAGDQEPLLVDLAGGDVQERQGLAGGRDGVGLDRQVCELEQLLVPDAGVAQRLQDRPGPEAVVLVLGEVAVGAVAAGAQWGAGAGLEDLPGLPVELDGRSGSGGLRGLQGGE